MKIAILFVAILAVSMAQQCRVFSCGTIQQEGEIRVCAQPLTEEATSDYRLEQCTGNMICDAHTWTDPSQVASSNCVNGEIPSMWPAEFTPEANTGVDGDICNEDANCYSSDINPATCSNNICSAKTSKGDACGENRDCPIGHYCGGDTDKTCMAMKSNGEECAAMTECQSQGCVQIDGEEQMKCVAVGSLKEGTKFTMPQSIEANAEVTLFPHCETYGAFVNDPLQCRRLTHNKQQGVDNLARDNAGDTCVTVSYTDSNLDNFKTEVEGSSSAKCGFNTDAKAYCPTQLGDNDVLDHVKAFFSKTQPLKCHIETQGGSGSVCKAFQEAQTSREGWRFHLSTSVVGDEQNFANVARNDRCVAETIMANHWEGQFGDSAYGLTAFASVFVMIASFIY